MYRYRERECVMYDYMYLFISMYNDIPTRDDCRKLRVYQADFDRP